MISELINGEKEGSIEILMALVMKGSRRDLLRLRDIWNHVDREEMKWIVGMGCEMTNIESIKYFIETRKCDIAKKYDLSAKRKILSHLVHMRSVCSSLSILKYRVSHGADVNQSNNIGNTPVWITSHNGHLSILKYLYITKQILIKSILMEYLQC